MLIALIQLDNQRERQCQNNSAYVCLHICLKHLYYQPHGCLRVKRYQKTSVSEQLLLAHTLQNIIYQILVSSSTEAFISMYLLGIAHFNAIPTSFNAFFTEFVSFSCKNSFNSLEAQIFTFFVLKKGFPCTQAKNERNNI